MAPRAPVRVESDSLQLRLVLMAGWDESSLVPPADYGLFTTGPLNQCGLKLGTRLNSIQQTLALFASQPPLRPLTSHLPVSANMMPLPELSG